MVNEKEEHYEEEGEYHFSDDQVNYDVEPESQPKATSTPAFTKEALLEKFSQNRKRILGMVALVVLVGVVYKILVPTTTTPTTEFKQTAVPTNVEKTAAVINVKSTPLPQPAPMAASPSVAAPAAATASAVPAATVAPPSVSAFPAIPAVSAAPPPNVLQTPPSVQNKVVSPIVMQQNQPPAEMVVVTSTPASPAANTMQQQSSPVSGMPPNVQASPVQAVILPPAQTMPMNAAPLSLDAQTKDRIAALEQQNTAMMNLLQTEYAQKIADTETQANVVRGRMEELTKRVNRMETNMNQIMQILQGASNKSQPSGVMGGASMPMPNVATRPGEPKMIYSVQAIIPGRAWLKSESGDTVTVAEGDYLKKYGRVTKIDPYDGVVAIDTGSRVITLSYGLDGE